MDELSQPSEDIVTEETAEVSNTELLQLQSDTYLVICEYLPKVYVVGILLLGCIVFAFVYKLIDNKFFRHLV